MAWRLGRDRGQAVTSLANLSTAGLAFALAVILGAALGYGVDRLLGTSPVGFLLGFVLGLVAGMLNVFRAAGVGRQN
jgi:ATP synthase protein I